MHHLTSVLQGLVFVLVLLVGSAGTAIAAGDGSTALGGPGSDRVVGACDGDKDDG
ncbi:MAG: hypothetical protein U5K43_13540 [Halofilum sp. (in: g-proteobacteria)]|nr:hypothetical protein [Halofilum sp. (in: g-proteobacteria)]